MKTSTKLANSTSGRLIGSLFIAVCLLGGAYLSNRPVNAACASAPQDKGVVSATAAVPSTGTYYIWSRDRTASANNNGYYLKVDSNCTIDVGDAPIPVNTWTWVNYQDGNTASRMSISLTAGTHTFNFYGLDPSVQVDRLVMTADSACTPTGTGDNCTNGNTTPPIVVTNPSPSGPTVVGTVQVGSANSGSKTTIKVDGKVVASGNGLVGVDTSSLTNGFHDLTVQITNPDGTTQTVTKRILVQNNEIFWRKGYNWLYKALDYNKTATNLVAFVVVTTVFTGIGVGILMGWQRRIWEKIPGIRSIHLKFLHLPSSQKSPSAAGLAGGMVVGDIRGVKTNPFKFKLFGHTFNPNLLAIATIAVFAVIGSAALLYSSASANGFVVEPETGTLTTATRVADSTAAGGSYIQFGTGVCPAGQTGTPPNCTTPPPPACPAGTTGTPPNCVATTCPAGTTGTPPNCVSVTTTNCALNIAAKACWAANTGVPKAGGGRWTEAQIVAGQSPLVHTVGDRNITVAGTVIDGQWIDGCIAIHANNVTIKNSLIRTSNPCVGGDANSGPAAVSTTGSITGLQVIDTEVDAGNTDDSYDYIGIGTENYSLLRVNVHGTTHTLWAGFNVTVRDSFIHDTSNATVTRHNETVDMDSSNHVTFDHNWISVVNGNYTQTQTAGIQDGGSWGPSHDNLITNNFLEGGQGTDLLVATAAYNTVVTNNHMSPHCWPSYSYSYQPNPGNVWTNNFDSETGAVANP